MVRSVCTRCGKLRIIIKIYKEKVENSVITHTITECSDKECQKLVNKNLQVEKKKRQFIKNEQIKREVARKQLIEEKKRHKKDDDND